VIDLAALKSLLQTRNEYVNGQAVDRLGALIVTQDDATCATTKRGVPGYSVIMFKGKAITIHAYPANGRITRNDKLFTSGDGAGLSAHVRLARTTFRTWIDVPGRSFWVTLQPPPILSKASGRHNARHLELEVPMRKYDWPTLIKTQAHSGQKIAAFCDARGLMPSHVLRQTRQTAITERLTADASRSQ
jgi:hypothetical protein